MQAKYLREGLEVYPRSLAQVQAQGALMDGAILLAPFLKYTP